MTHTTVPRNHILIRKILALIVVLAALVLSLRQCTQPANVTVKQSPTEKLAQLEQPTGKVIDTQLEQEKQQKAEWSPTAAELKAMEATEAVFYGKVVDMDNAPVAGAEIVCQPNHDPWVSNLRRTVLKSGEDGSFFIREANAPTISVSVTAVGYYTTNESAKSFGFAELPASIPDHLRQTAAPRTKTTKENPGLFKLRKLTSREPLVARTKSGRLKEQQTYVIGLNSEHSIHVKYLFDPAAKRMHPLGGWPMHDWAVEISVNGGSIQRAANPQTDIPESWLAPETGYQQMERFAYDGTMDAQTYERTLQTAAFVRFNDGKFARLALEFESDASRPLGRVASWFNPSGSRATEPDSTMYIEVPPDR